MHLRCLGKPLFALSTDQIALQSGQTITQALSGPRTSQEGLEGLQFTARQSPTTDHSDRWFWLVLLANLRFVQEPCKELRERLGFLLLQ